MLLLVINPGSTSTKVAVYQDDTPVLTTDIAHTQAELARFPSVMDQQDYRRDAILAELARHDISLHFDGIIARGGLARPMPSGVYEVDQQMLHETRHARHKHACDLGCLIAHDIAELVNNNAPNNNEKGTTPHPCKAYIADPGCVDEMAPEAHISGLPELPRICIWHALNQKAICRRFAREHGKRLAKERLIKEGKNTEEENVLPLRYEDLNLIACHLGGGISIAAHDHGRAIDANNALDGEGPFSPERTGSLPVKELADLCFSGKYSQAEINNLIAGRGGLVAHLGTNDMRVIEQRIREGDRQAKLITDAMIWHTAKAICAEGAVLQGRVDAILLMGGLAHSPYVVEGLKARIAWLAPVHVYPGQNEMEALAQNLLGRL